MARQRNELHAKQVEAWKKKTSGLSSNDRIRLFIKAIQAVRERSLATLSGVTVAAVIDRTLYECKEKFPVLAEIDSDSDGLHFDKLTARIQQSKPDEILLALEELLIELMDIFGKITAEILTKYLHQELMTVTNEAPAIGSEARSPRSSGLAKKNRDQK